jgi:hypothetical protein
VNRCWLKPRKWPVGILGRLARSEIPTVRYLRGLAIFRWRKTTNTRSVFPPAEKSAD